MLTETAINAVTTSRTVMVRFISTSPNMEYLRAQPNSRNFSAFESEMEVEFRIPNR
jgi:hypothetical protein